MKYALLTAAVVGLALPALAQAPGTPEYTTHEGVIRDCVIAKAGGHEAFGEPPVPSTPLHPTIRATKSRDPHAPQLEVDFGYGNRRPDQIPHTGGRAASVTETDLHKFTAQCRHENP
jgi:hypothetical protein